LVSCEFHIYQGLQEPTLEKRPIEIVGTEVKTPSPEASFEIKLALIVNVRCLPKRIKCCYAALIDR
jgi:hypothetical protein